MKNSLLLLIGIIVTWLPVQIEAAPYAIVTRAIHLNGYKLFVDSFDSTDPFQSTGGHYDPNKGGGDSAVVAAETGIFNANNVGVVDLWGRLETELPYTLEIGSQSSIGSSAWHQAGQSGVELNYHTTNTFPMLPDVPFPLPGIVPAPGVHDGVSYNYVLETDKYELSELVMSGGQKLLVRGSAQLGVRGNVSLSGNSQIVILPAASLRLYVAGSVANLRGGGVVNQGVARNFLYLGTTNNASVNLRVTTPFVGMVYAPNAALSVSRHGNVMADLQGSVIANSIELESNVNFHYDQAIGY